MAKSGTVLLDHTERACGFDLDHQFTVEGRNDCTSGPEFQPLRPWVVLRRGD